jgi:hypothetical protein
VVLGFLKERLKKKGGGGVESNLKNTL